MSPRAQLQCTVCSCFFRKPVPAYHGAAQVMIVPAIPDKYRYSDLFRNLTEHFPESLLRPVSAVSVCISDPVPVPVEMNTPECFIYFHLRAVSAGFQIICLNLFPRICHAPPGKDILTKQSVLINRRITICSVNSQIHAFYLLRHRIGHAPACGSQIGISPVSDGLHLRKCRKIIHRVKAILTLIRIRLPFSFRAICSSAPLNNETEPPSGILLTVNCKFHLLMRIAASCHHARERSPVLRKPELCAKMYSI